MAVYLEKTEKARKLFGDWQETIIWSCLEKVMGDIYADNQEDPRSVMAVLGDFCFLAGKPDRELAAFRPKNSSQEFLIMVPQNRQWGQVIQEYYGEKARKFTRYAIKKETDFDRHRLSRIVESLSPEYELRMMDEACFGLCRANEWSRDLVSQFEDWPMYERLGLGAVVLNNGMVVSGASSYSRYTGGIEIEIDTKEEYRRKGLASVCGARLILACLDRGLYPSWDAHNMRSVKLAEKLGYVYDHEYEAYEIKIG